MNPFQMASSLGFKKENIISFLKKANPNFENFFSQALLAGYTADQAYDFLGKMFSGSKVPKKVEKQVRSGFNSSNLVRQAQFQDPSRKDVISPLIGGTVGAVAGGLTGGPIGAVAGGYTGYKEMKRLSDAYEDHIQRGGKLPFGDFVKSIIKTIGISSVMGSQQEALLNAAKEYLKSSDKETPQQEPTIEEPIQPDVLKQEGVGVEEPIQPEIIEPQEQIQPKNNLKDSYKIFEKMGASNIIDGISNQLEGFDQYKAIRNLYGNEFIKDLEKQYKRPADEIINEAFEYSRQKKQNQNQRLEQAQVVEQEKLPQVEQERSNYNIDPYEAEEFTSIFKSAVPSKEYRGRIQKDIKPLENSLKSSNVVGAFYDEKTKKLRTLFRKGEAYEYDNISLKELENVTGGKAKPITEGSTQYGFWFPDKKKSVGAAFSKFIKKKAEEFPYRKLDRSELNKNESQLRESEKTFIASSLFEPFKKQQKKGQQKEKGIQLRLMEPALKEADDEFLQEIVEFIEGKINLKSPIKMTRLQKEFKKEFL